MKYSAMFFSALIALSFISPANADIRKIGQVGVWEIFSGASHNGTPVCSIGSSSPRGERSIAIKYFGNSDKLEIDIFNNRWSIPEGLTTSIQFYIDNNDKYKVIAAKDQNTNHSLFWFIGGDSIEEFENEFRSGSLLRIHFLEDSEPDWTISLNGADGAMNELAICIDHMTNEESLSPSTPQFNVPTFRSPPSREAPSGPIPLVPPMGIPSPSIPTEPVLPPLHPNPDSKSVIPPHNTPHYNNET